MALKAASGFPSAHSLYKCYMRIISKSDGIARFVKDPKTLEPAPTELTRQSMDFRNMRFGNYINGTIVFCTFRLSFPNGRRYLLNVRSNAEPLHSFAEVPVTDEKIRPAESLVENGYYYPPDARRVFTVADKLAKTDGMFAMMMVGPSGYGKTTIPMKFAEKTGRQFVRVNCAAIRDPEEWLGFREARDGTTIFEPTEFAQAIQAGGAVIVLDEANRIEPWLHNTLFPLLDFSRKTRVHNTEFIVGVNTIFVLTINRGIEYAGTFELDQAFLNRVNATVHVGPPPAEVEEDILLQREGINGREAKKIIDVSNALRQVVEKGEIYVDCSTRAALKIAQISKLGLTLRECFHDVIETVAIREEDRKKIADILNSKLGVMTTATIIIDDAFKS